MHVFTKEKQNKNYPTFLVTLVHCVKYYTHVFYNMNYLALIITFQGLLLYLLLGGASKKEPKGSSSPSSHDYLRDLGRY